MKIDSWFKNYDMKLRGRVVSKIETTVTYEDGTVEIILSAERPNIVDVTCHNQVMEEESAFAELRVRATGTQKHLYKCPGALSILAITTVYR